MALNKIITACGGNKNLRRALRVGDNVILELVEPELRAAEIKALPFSADLSQITWQPETPLTEKEWHYVGKIIEENQRELLAQLTETNSAGHRPKWHFAPKQGLLNDPNGFIFHQGEYHLFYGLDPLVPGDKNRYWVHFTSTDLVNWHEKPVALYPSDWYDCHGVYSGHAVSTDEELMLFYTGNVRVGENRDRVTTQCLATSRDGVNFVKHGPVISELPPGVTPHCRDPKLIRNQDHWLMLLGAQQESEDGKLQGRLAMYRSDDLYSWSYVGLAGGELGEFGYMWECPDLFNLDDQLLSVFCPQGIPSDSEFYNIPHHSGYAEAGLDAMDNLSVGNFTQLDHGFDFYASQTTQASDGRRLLIGWMGMPDEIDQPSCQDGWVHQLTCIRELSWNNGRLCQKPARELQAMRGEQHQIEVFESATRQLLPLNTKSYELHTYFVWPEKGKVTLRLMDNGMYYVDFILDADKQRILLDRSHTLPTDGELIREIAWPTEKDVQLQILADSSSVELFINDGEYVMTSRVFTPENATNIQLSSTQPYCWKPVTYWPFD